MAAPNATYLLLRHRTFHFRCRLPVAVAAVVGRRELVRTLKTAEIRLARFRASVMALRLPELWARLRVAKVSDDLTGLIDEWLEREAERAWRLLDGFAGGLHPDDADPDRRRDMDREYFARDAELTLDRLAAEYAEGRFDAGKPGARSIAAGLAAPLPEDGRDFAVLCKRVMEARGAIEEARIRWAEGEVEHSPESPVGFAPARDLPPAGAATMPDQAVRGSRTLKAAVDVHLEFERHEGRLTPRGLTQLRGELRVLTDAFGEETPAAAVGTRDAGRILEALRSLPPNYRNRTELAGLGLFAAAERSRELGLEGLNPRTVKGYLGSFRKLFEQECAAGTASANPFANAKLPRRRRSAAPQPKREFARDELAAVFGSPLFAGSRDRARPYDPGSHLVGTWRFWAPMIALLTGARVAEIAQLRPGDVRCEGGVWVFDLNDEDGKRLKTEAARRIVPVHDELIRLGLVRLAGARLRAKDAWLLPERPAPIGGDPGKQIGRWMSEDFLPRFGLRKRRGLGFHGFRHAVKTMLRNAGVEERTNDILLGHKPAGTGGDYGSFTPRLLKDAIDRMDLPREVLAIPSRL